MNVVFLRVRQGLFLSYQLNIALVTYMYTRFYLIYSTMNKTHFEKSAYKDDQIVGLSKKTATDNTSTFLILSLLDQDHRIDRYCYLPFCFNS